jgi:hypothetical protein
VVVGCVVVGAADAQVRVRRRATRSDTASTQTVTEIRISDRGIHVDTEGDTVVAGGRVTIGPTSIEVEDGGSGMVKMFANARVEKDKHVVGEVVTVFGDIEIEGEVSGDVVAVMGSVKLGPEAIVDGDVVAVGGGIERHPSSQVQGDTVGISLLPLLTWGLPTVPVVVVTLIVAWAFSLFVGWLVNVIFPERFVNIAVTSSRRSGASFLLGVLSGPLCFLVMLLLFITLIGIPLAFLLPPLFVVASYIGQLAATYVLGCRLLPGRRSPEEGRNLIPALAAGAGLILALFLVGVVLAVFPGLGRVIALFFSAVGALLLLGITAIGTGAVILSRGGSRAPGGPAISSAAVPVPPLSAEPQPAP